MVNPNTFPLSPIFERMTSYDVILRQDFISKKRSSWNHHIEFLKIYSKALTPKKQKGLKMLELSQKR